MEYASSIYLTAIRVDNCSKKLEILSFKRLYILN